MLPKLSEYVLATQTLSFPPPLAQAQVPAKVAIGRGDTDLLCDFGQVTALNEKLNELCLSLCLVHRKLLVNASWGYW